VKAQLLAAGNETTFLLVFDKGDEAVEGLTAFAREQRLEAGHFTGIGALSDVVVGYFDRGRRKYKRIAIPEQVEILSLIGDIALERDEQRVHAHVVVGKADGTAHGGHLLEAHVWPTLEVVVVQNPTTLRKRFDPETGLALIDVDRAGSGRAGAGAAWSAAQRRVTGPVEKSVVNPLVRFAFSLGVPPPGDALLETIGRRSGEARVTPVCDGLEGDTFWLIAAHGRRANYMRNIEANPRVRVKMHGEWRAGTAHILDDDDPLKREELLSQGNLPRRLCLRTSRATSTELLTVRVDLDRS
jgi:deazaflavin-dependent oxidoreductase (nitroreductase family)